MKENKKAELGNQSSEIVSGLADWRQQNPQATFGEIERETMKRMGQLQARIMQEIALESAAKDWKAEDAPKCPECGEEMKKSSTEIRRLQAQGGYENPFHPKSASKIRCPLHARKPGTAWGLDAVCIHHSSFIILHSSFCERQAGRRRW